MTGAKARTDPYAVFRPRWGTRVPTGAAIVMFVAFAAAAVTIPGAEWTLLDRLFLFLLGVVMAWFLQRFARIEARPGPDGIVVRNLFTTRRLDWAQILGMQFGGGAPWVTVELNDTDTVAIMAIQKADGAHGRTQAARLAALITHHSAPEPGAP